MGGNGGWAARGWFCESVFLQKYKNSIILPLIMVHPIVKGIKHLFGGIYTLFALSYVFKWTWGFITFKLSCGFFIYIPLIIGILFEGMNILDEFI